MGRERVRLGEIGENLACAELERRGYAILARRYRRRCGEIDIVARGHDGRTTVFVEVKTRAGGEFGSAPEAVTRLKRRRIVTTAIDYLTRHRLTDRPCRFDVVAVAICESGPIVEVIPNAFDASASG